MELPGHIEGASLQDCRARIDLMRALSSANYIALTSPDPVESCFKLSQLVRWLAQAELELADEYLKIEEHCEALAAEFVNAVEDSDDIMALLSMQEGPDGVTTVGEPLCRLEKALIGNHKLFVAHSHCQLALADQFIEGITG